MYNFSKFSIKSQSFLFCSSLISATCHQTRWRCDVQCVRPIQGEHSPLRKRQTVSKSAHSGSLASTESGGEAELTDISQESTKPEEADKGASSFSSLLVF